jgi:hypothetical protein
MGATDLKRRGLSTMKPARRSVFPARVAFSLVEVVIALGIVTFGIVSIFALLPVGLQLVRESTDESVALGILTMVGSDVQAQITNPSDPPESPRDPAKP